jgi:GNAT superfamily N-acetyltransferase
MGEVRFSTESYGACSQELIAFRNANRALARGPEYFQWRYLKRPNGAEPIIVWARDASGEIAGSLSVIPHHYHVGDTVCRIGVLGDISVSEKYRGKGIAKEMFGYLSGLKPVKNLNACIVLPNKEALRPLEKSGWVTVARLERYVKLLSTREIIERRLNKKISGLVSPVLDFFLKLATREVPLRERSGYKGALEAGFDGRFDELWAALNKDGMIIGLRNREYLTWRFTDHPLEKYGVYALSRDSRLCGYIVFHSNGNAYHIDDFLSLREGESRDCLFSYFIEHVRKSGLASKIVINLNNDNPTGANLRKFGFFKSPDFLNFMVLQNGNAPGILSEGNTWFITAGDKDV